MRRPVPPLAAAAVPLATVAATLIVATGAQAAPPQTLYYERVLMGEAGARCGLFPPDMRRALAAGAAQARGAASAADQSPASLDATAARAIAKARAVDCLSPELRIAAQRVRAAFMSWSHKPDLVLPGRTGMWRAQRWRLARGPYWALVERGALAGAPVALGFLDDGRAPSPQPYMAAAVAWPEGGRAYAARLVMRDPDRAAAPYLNGDRVPPPAQSRSFLAQSRAPGAKAILPTGGVVWRFPMAAADALARIDGREAVRLELAFALPDGERVVSTTLEAGDFATGRAFLDAGR